MQGEVLQVKGKLVLTWCREHKILFIAFAMALLPLICAAFYCALRGGSLSEVYLPASEWNDELFYFKQVEAILSHGIPQGYYGFNESHALRGSFAAWSPVLVWPWLLWGLIFGWNLMSPILCNIFTMSAAVFIFVLLVKPNGKQLGILVLLYAAFGYHGRYMLACMPEALCCAMGIVVLALFISALERESPAKIVALFILTAVMTLMRPYLILFMLLPAFMWIRKNRLWGILGSVCIAGVSLAVYAWINVNLGAAYFTPLFDTRWIKAFLESGIAEGVRVMGSRVLSEGATVISMVSQGFQNGLAGGARFAGFLLVMIILAGQALTNFRKKEKNQMIVNGLLAVIFVGMFSALLLMYKMTEGSRHLAAFISVGIFAISMMRTKTFKKVALVGAVFVYLYYGKAVDPFDYAVPFYSEERAEQMAVWDHILDEKLDLVEENAPSFDNVVIWVFMDVKNEQPLMTNWQYLYGLPEGFGVSCTLREYVLENFENLQSKYLAVAENGEIDDLCRAEGKTEIGRSGGMVLYQMYSVK